MKNTIFIFLFLLVANFMVAQKAILRPPAELTADHLIEDSNVTLYWWEPGTPAWMHYDSGRFDTYTGTGEAGEYDAAIKFEPGDLNSYEGYTLTQFAFVPTEETSTYVITFWSGENADKVIYSDTLESFTNGQWNIIALDSSIVIDVNKTYYFGYHTINFQGNPIGIQLSDNVVPGKSDLIRFSDGFFSLSEAIGTNVNINIWVYGELLGAPSTNKILTKNDVNNNWMGDGKLSYYRAQNFSTFNIPAVKNDSTPNNYIVYRDSFAIDTVITNNYHDILPTGGEFEYAVSALYDSGESEKCIPLIVQYDTARIPVNKVIGEVFINTSPGLDGAPTNSNGAFMGITELAVETENLIPIVYHSLEAVLGPDPFINTYSEERVAEYLFEFMGFPIGVFNGIYGLAGGNPNESLFDIYNTLYSQANSRLTPISLDGSIKKVSNTQYDLDISAEIIGMYKDTDLVLHTVVVHESVPYYWNDSTFKNVKYVATNMFPDASGTPILFDEEGKSNTTVSVTMDPFDQVEEFQVVVFIQDTEDNTILNGDQFALPIKKNVDFYVIDDMNNPIADAAITIGEEIFTTGADGHKTIGLWNNLGEINYTIQKENYYEYPGVFNIDTTESITIQLTSVDTTNISFQLANKTFVYPNPAANVLNIESLKGSFIKIINNAGVEVENFKLNEAFQQIDISDFNSGVYVILIQSNSERSVKRFIKL